MKNWRAVASVIVGLICLCVISCRSMLDRVTPSDIPAQSLAYVEKKPADVIPTLNTAKEVRTEIIVKHRNKQIDLKRLAEDDKLAYTDALGFIKASIAESTAMQELLIGSETQPLSILGLLAGAGIAFPVGKILKRKGDYSPEEFKAALTEAKEQAKAENVT